ncbi:MAG: hypothetical protein WKF77_28845 [Planctomycetaceae bacterium]
MGLHLLRHSDETSVMPRFYRCQIPPTSGAGSGSRHLFVTGMAAATLHRLKNRPD